MKQSYAVLRVIQVATGESHTPASRKVPDEERKVHLLYRPTTTVGRSLQSDVILMDPSVSREHARLCLGEEGWQVTNVSEQNIVRVNSCVVPSGASWSLLPEDFLVLGSITLQLVAPSDLHQPLEDWPAASLPQLYENNGKLIRPSTPAPVTLIDTFFQELPADDMRRKTSELSQDMTQQLLVPFRVGIRTRRLLFMLGILLLCILAVVTAVLFALTGNQGVSLDGLSSSIGFIIPVLPALVIGLLVNFIDRFEREPWRLRLVAFLWGALIAIPVALFFEQNLDALIVNSSGANDFLRSLLQALNAGVIEETAKGIGLLLLFLFLRDEFDNVTDGIIYGALIGAGFAMVENSFYFVVKSRDYLVVLIVGRIVLGWLCHSTFTMCLGAALGYVRHTKVGWRRLLVPLLGYLAAAGLHTIFDFVQLFANSLILSMPGRQNIAPTLQIVIVGDYIFPYITQLFLLYILIRALAHEAAVIREFLASEVTTGIVGVDEYVIVQDSWLRTRLERQALRERGWRYWLLLKALYQAQINLAFRKWHSHMEDRPRLGYRHSEADSRQRIVRLRQRLQKI